MTEPKPAKKRVVSKSKYAAYLARITTLTSGSVLLGIGGIFSIYLAIIFLMTSYQRPSPSFEELRFHFSYFLFFGIGGSLLMMGAVKTGKKVTKIEPVLPPTRENLEQLPAEETLVRASTKPTVEQEKTLLRAASGAVEQTPQDQLLRPRL